MSFRGLKEPNIWRCIRSAGFRPMKGGSRVVRDRSDRPHLAQHYASLLPDDAKARARAPSPWMFAALNTVEPPILELVTAKIFEARQTVAPQARLPLVKDRVRERLQQVSAHLGDVRVARRRVQRGRSDDGVGAAALAGHRACSMKFPNLASYVGRGEARPGLQARAFAALWR